MAINPKRGPRKVRQNYTSSPKDGVRARKKSRQINATGVKRPSDARRIDFEITDEATGETRTLKVQKSKVRNYRQNPTPTNLKKLERNTPPFEISARDLLKLVDASSETLDDAGTIRAWRGDKDAVAQTIRPGSVSRLVYVERRDDATRDGEEVKVKPYLRTIWEFFTLGNKIEPVWMDISYEDFRTMESSKSFVKTYERTYV